MTTWPDLSDQPLVPTLETLHLWSQVVGKVRLMLTPWENHGWHVPFYITPRGIGTGLVPVPARAFSIEFDFIAGALIVRVSDGGEGRVALEPQSVAAFHSSVLTTLGELGIAVSIDPMPTEIKHAVRFDNDTQDRGFDLGVIRTYWRALVEVHRVFQLFRTRFIGKTSPIHLFWGAFDLALTRFSGRVAPSHPGGAPYMNDAIARDAYSREVSSAGFWPNLSGADGPSFYSYAYPSPKGFAGRQVLPVGARYDDALGEYILPYATMRASEDPDATLLTFLQTTYEAAADLAGWDRPALEREQGLVGRPPKGS